MLSPRMSSELNKLLTFLFGSNRIKQHNNTGLFYHLFRTHVKVKYRLTIFQTFENRC
jgi:hypothetical protein